jgi:hypothetical protein
MKEIYRQQNVNRPLKPEEKKVKQKNFYHKIEALPPEDVDDDEADEGLFLLRPRMKDGDG